MSSDAPEKGFDDLGIPDNPHEGVQCIQGSYDGSGLRVAVVASRFNPDFTEPLIASVLDALEQCGCSRDQVLLIRVPGAYEIPPVVEDLAERGLCRAIVAAGVVIEGETPHAELINRTIATGLSQTSSRHRVPVIDCVVAVREPKQAESRCLTGRESRGWYAGLAAVETASVYEQLIGLR